MEEISGQPGHTFDGNIKLDLKEADYDLIGLNRPKIYPIGGSYEHRLHKGRITVSRRLCYWLSVAFFLGGGVECHVVILKNGTQLICAIKCTRVCVFLLNLRKQWLGVGM
jgi:hypothetical protein